MTDRNIFNNPYGVAVALIPIIKDGIIYLLGAQRNIDPCRFGFVMPGGYINTMETTKIAGVRETFEETSLQLNEEDFILYDEAISPNNNHLIFILYTKEPILYDDIDWTFSCDETLKNILIDVNVELCFPLQDKVAKRFFREFAIK